MDLAGFTASLSAQFGGPGDESSQVSEFATAVRLLTNAIVPAVPAATQDAAKIALQGALSGVSEVGQGFATLDTAMASYASSLAAAMSPPGTPPPAVLSASLTAVYNSNQASGADRTTAALSVATTIHAWFTTGLSSAMTPWS